jgi:hypothetical protein
VGKGEEETEDENGEDENKCGSQVEQLPVDGKTELVSVTGHR